MSKHSPHWTEVSSCLSMAWSSELHDGHENWYVLCSPATCISS